MNKNLLLPLAILGAGVFFVVEALMKKKPIDEVKDALKELAESPTNTPPAPVVDVPPAPVESVKP